MTATSSTEVLLYQRLYISADDLGMAGFFAHHLLKKGWHFAPWENRRRWSTYMQQAAFTSAFVTAYARPFTKSFGWPPFPDTLVTFDATERKFHKHLLTLRNEVYAHSDSARHVVKPVRIIGHPSAIVGSPPLRLSKDELERAIKMIEKLQVSVRGELQRLMILVEAPFDKR